MAVHIEGLNADELRDLIRAEVRQAVSGIEPSRPAQNEFLTVEEAGHLLSYSTQGIYGLISKRELPYYKKGKRVYFKRSEIEAWLEDGRQETFNELKNGAA